MKIVAGLIPTFPLPKPSAFCFRTVFTATDDDSKQRLTDVDALREAVVAAAMQNNPAGAATALDQYMPALRSIMDSADAHQGNPRMASHSFVFTSGGDKTSSTQKATPFTLYTLSYEMCMMASMRGYCECNMAGIELESPTSTGDDPCKKALARLKSAASIFSCIATQLLPLKESLPVLRAPEVVPGYHRALEQMCRGSCQLLAINQAILRGMAVPLVAKLYSGAALIFEDSHQTLISLRSDWNDLDPAIKNFIGGSPQYFRAVAHRLLGASEWEAGNHGEALGHMRSSKKRFDGAFKAGLMHFASKSLTERVEADRASTIELLALYEKENGLIYFGRVPNEEKLVEAKVVAAETVATHFPGGVFRVQLQ